MHIANLNFIKYSNPPFKIMLKCLNNYCKDFILLVKFNFLFLYSFTLQEVR